MFLPEQGIGGIPQVFGNVDDVENETKPLPAKAGRFLWRLKVTCSG
jgi:hypothetical protein